MQKIAAVLCFIAHIPASALEAADEESARLWQGSIAFSQPSQPKNIDCTETATDKSGNSARTSEQVRCVFDSYGRTLNDIYMEKLSNGANISGTIVLKFSVSPSGVVTTSDVISNSTNSKELATSMSNAVKGFKFPAQKVEPYIGTHHLNFSM